MKHNIDNQIAAVQTARIGLASSEYKDALSEAWKTLDDYHKCLKMINNCLADGIPIEKNDPIHHQILLLLNSNS